MRPGPAAPHDGRGFRRPGQRRLAGPLFWHREPGPVHAHPEPDVPQRRRQALPGRDDVRRVRPAAEGPRGRLRRHQQQRNAGHLLRHRRGRLGRHLPEPALREPGPREQLAQAQAGGSEDKPRRVRGPHQGRAADGRGGSNDWVVSGAHTVTGKPLLSNDMHLCHRMPNLWYEAHLHAGTLDVAGVTLPGMPYVIVGHNQRIAWGFTNVGPTVTDVYIENFNEQGAYQTPSGWVQPEHRVEVIRVKGRPDVSVDVKITPHGPVITELVPGETRPLALRWTLYDSLQIPFFDVNAAQNWQEFRHAFSQLDAPGQNVVYADEDGNIGYQTTGKIPIRAAGDGSLPVSGADNAHEWTSYIAFEKLPSIYNPPSGIIATANGRI